MVTTRIHLYPEGEEGEITLGESDAAMPVPGVGDRVQVLDVQNGYTPESRGLMYEVTRREFYFSRYGQDRTVAEVALYVKEAA